ncbi:response regulator transcription factor [Vibrio sp. TH_r3]|uniref:response regulator transcription factor n=1 Tax=Vibrio sp. TH_r3 TaxID=3082084 RepID=UPI002954F26C|nr:response regulator transcription factor [Vibrio sp. TH_r3]MDV7105790.1 response regulator transcription factor [Vibrio sp. TH_r3]
MKLLLVEDSLSLRNSLKIGLENLGFTVDDTGDGSEGLTMALMQEYDLMILDLMLPNVDGLTILKTIRRSKNALKVLILSAKGESEDRVQGLMTGADDYLAKPFSFDELHARLLALSRRGGLLTNDNVIKINDFVLNTHLVTLSYKEKRINLTPNEYKLIECIFKQKHVVMSPEKLSEHIAGQYDTISKNAIEAHLSSARKKARAAGGTLPIINKRGFGYMVALES